MRSTRPMQRYVFPDSDWRQSGGRMAALVLIPVLLAVGLYLNSIGNGFTYDDFRSVVLNACVTGEAPLGEALARDVWCIDGPASTGSWRPLTVLVLRGVHTLGGLRDWPYHLVSVGLYGLLVLIAIAFLLQLTDSGRATFIAALLFAAHPVHSEAVASVSAMGDLLAAVLGLLGLYVYAGIIDRPREWWRRLLALPLIFMAMLAKESAVTLFGVMLLLDGWALLRPAPQIFRKPNAARGLRLALPWALALVGLIVYILVRVSLFERLTPTIHASDNPLAALNGAAYFATAFSALGEYLRLLIYPLRLSVEYGFNQIPVLESFGYGRAVWPLLLLVLSLGLALFLMLRRAFAAAFAILFVWATLSLASNLVVTIPTIVAERLLLVPSLGVCMLAGIFLDGIFPRPGHRLHTLLIVAFMVLVIGMGWRTTARTLDWQDNLTLFKAAAKASPQSRKVHLNLGWWLRNEGLWTRALRHYRKADAIAPERRDIFLERELGICYHGQGNFEQAIFHYERVLGGSPKDDLARVLLGEAKAQRIPSDLAKAPRDSSQTGAGSDADPPPDKTDQSESN